MYMGQERGSSVRLLIGLWSPRHPILLEAAWEMVQGLRGVVSLQQG